MTGRKTQREWGTIRKQPTKSTRYQASYVGPDLRRHYAPVTFSSKMIAERWLDKEKQRIDTCAASDGGLSSWKPPEIITKETKIKAETLSEYGERWIDERNIKAGTRIEYKAKFSSSITSSRSWAATRYAI